MNSSSPAIQWHHIHAYKIPNPIDMSTILVSTIPSAHLNRLDTILLAAEYRIQLPVSRIKQPNSYQVMGLRLKQFFSITDDWTFLVNYRGSFWSCPCQDVICVLLLECFSRVLLACLPYFPQGALMVQNNGSCFSLVSGPSISIQQKVMTLQSINYDMMKTLSMISIDSIYICDW